MSCDNTSCRANEVQAWGDVKTIVYSRAVLRQIRLLIRLRFSLNPPTWVIRTNQLGLDNDIPCIPTTLNWQYFDPKLQPTRASRIPNRKSVGGLPEDHTNTTSRVNSEQGPIGNALSPIRVARFHLNCSRLVFPDGQFLLTMKSLPTTNNLLTAHEMQPIFLRKWPYILRRGQHG